MYTEIRYDWDEEKAKKNELKHGITFMSAANAFNDPNALLLDDAKHSIIELRQWLIGETDVGIVVVVFAPQSTGSVVRIISVRHANYKERKRYEENKGV